MQWFFNFLYIKKSKFCMTIILIFMNLNDNIIDEFKKLVKQIQFDIDHSANRKDKLSNTFRLQNIKIVLKIIEQFPKKIISVDQLKGIAGVGKGSLQRIEEILKTGKLSEINDDAINDKYMEYLDELEDVFGIGRRLAFELFTKYKVKSINELKKLYESGKIVLPDNVVKGLKYYDISKGNIPRQEIDKTYNFLALELNTIDRHLFGTICGSYRRLKLISNDIDLMIIHPKIKTQVDLTNNKLFKIILKKLVDIGFLIESFTGFDVKSKFMGLCQLSKNYPVRRIDIRFIPFESYYYSLLYFTGSGEFNRKMRRIAIDNDYVLNEYGLYEQDGKLALRANSEITIFKFLGMEYITPDKREVK